MISHASFYARIFLAFRFFVKILIVIALANLIGCATNKSFRPMVAECPVDQFCTPTSTTNLVAVFRGTGNTYCGFLQELSIPQNRDIDRGKCFKGKTVKGAEVQRVARIGDAIPYLDERAYPKKYELAKAYLTNPLTGEPFPRGTVFFFPGSSSVMVEFFRAPFETLFGVTDKAKRFSGLSGQTFSEVFCHSNGCTQAQAAAKNGFISIEHLYHLGSPWLTSNTNLDGTVHTIFDQSFDPIGLLSFVRFFHIPFTSLDRTLSSSDKSNQIFQEIGAAPLIFLDSSGHNGLSHALANYMLAIHIWHSNLEEAAVLLKSDSIVPESIGTYPFKEFVDPGIRSSFAIYFNIEQYPKGYRGFNLQRGIRNCGSSVRKSDCRSLVYANHELAKHSFSDATWYGSKLHNAFSTLHEATSCIDKLIDIEKTPISSQLSVSVFSACSKKETTGRESMVFEQAML
ncbi:MAG: hypothetical protein KDI33_20990 [Halioglobus sp.]|nr:hypothetical protein [Halioglobus sp.]